MPSDIIVNVLHQTLHLLPEKAIYWKDAQTLIVSDLHLGKAGHFRKSGIPAPSAINLKNIKRLDDLMQRYMPQRLLMLGDLFHSDANREWLEFEQFTQKWSTVEMLLVRGNHDSLHPSFYDAAGIVSVDILEESGFIFLHDASYDNNANKDIVGNINNEEIVLSGHIHPGVTLRGKGRQSLRLPCFIISSQQILLPAFGEFTGLHTINPKPDEHIYAVAENMVIPL